MWNYNDLKNWIDNKCYEIFITELDISNNNLIQIPEEIKYIKTLKYFNCSNNNITVIPDFLTSLTNLEIFIFENNKITDISQNILKFIKVLSIKQHLSQNIELIDENILSLKDICDNLIRLNGDLCDKIVNLKINVIRNIWIDSYKEIEELNKQIKILDYNFRTYKQIKL